jgi:hypothetical protein
VDGRGLCPQDRGIERGSEALEKGHDLIPRHEPIRVLALVFEAGQLAPPVGDHKSERGPAIPPRLGDPRAFEDEMIDGTPSQMIARGKASLASPDDDYIRTLDHVPLP